MRVKPPSTPSSKATSARGTRASSDKSAPPEGRRSRRNEATSRAPASTRLELSPTLARWSGPERRDPQLGATFVGNFNERLNLSSEVLAARAEHMAESPLAFFQANPALFYADLAGSYASMKDLLGRPAPRIVIDGDSHLANFGTFRGPDGHAVWGLNDFDQAGTGSPEWDLERLATSAVLAARAQGLGAKDQEKLVKAITDSYFSTIHDLSKGRLDGEPFLDEKAASGDVKDLIQKAEKTKRKDFLAELVDDVDSDRPKFLQNDELRPVSAERRAELTASLQTYAKSLPSGQRVAVPLQILDVAEKLGSGGSSFGVPRYYALVASAEPGKKPVVLEIKQCLPVPISDQTPDLSRADPAAIVRNAHTLGGLPNPLSGAAPLDGQSFLVRELEPEKARVKPEKLDDARSLKSLATQAAAALARAHGQNDQAELIDDWVGNDADKASRRLVDFAIAYADQDEADLAAFKRRAQAG